MNESEPPSSKSSRKPVVSSKLPKAFSQPKSLVQKRSAKPPTEKNSKVPLSPTKRASSSVSKVLHKVAQIPDSVAAPCELPNSLSLQQLITLSTLHSGKSGVTKKSLHAPSLTLFAVNEIPVSSIEARQKLLCFLKGWKRVQRKIPGLVEVTASYWNSPEGWVSVVLQYMSGGSLADLYEAVGAVPERILTGTTRRILQVLQYFHRKVGVHGGIDATSILFSKSGQPQFGPGLSSQVSKDPVLSDSFSGDVFDLGCTLLSACLGTEIFGYSHGKESACCLFHTLRQNPEHVLLARLSPLFADFLCKSTMFAEKERAQVSGLLAHKWLSSEGHGPLVDFEELTKVYLGTTRDFHRVTVDKQLAKLLEALGWVLQVCGERTWFSESNIEVLASEIGVPKEVLRNKLEGLIN